MNIARFDKRLFAWLIDLIIPALCGIGLCIFLFWALGTNLSVFLTVVIGVLGGYLVYVIVESLVMFLSNGSTLGMSIFSIRCIHQEGGKISYGESLLKALLSGILVVDLINGAYMLISHTELTIFDRMSGTMTVDKKSL